MHDAHEFLRSLTVVLAVAALTTVLFQKLRQPVVLGYIIAGLIVGPHVPVPLIADREIVQTLSELGVILLMFSLGLEFSFAKLVRVAPTAGITAAIQSAVMAWLGFLVGRLLGWTVLESVFAGAVVAISSTTIIAKVFDEQRIGGRLRELVVGVLLVEDLIAIIFMTALTAVGTGATLSAGALLPTVGRLAGFLVVVLLVGLLVIPRFTRFVLTLGRPETTLVASVGICFVLAFSAQAFGFSVALGAFLAGSLVAESGRGEEIEHLVRPLRDMFLAIFFVSVGLLIDPALVARHWVAVAVFTILVIGGKVVSVTIAAFLTGSGTRTAIQAGMSLAQIGEFSFIIAALGTSLGVARDFLYPVAVAVSAITTLTSPWLIRAAAPVARFTDRKLPHRLQTFATLYGTWLERLRATATPRRSHGNARLVRVLALDAVLIASLIIGVALLLDGGSEALAGAAGVAAGTGRVLIVAGGVVASLPLLVGVGRLARRLGDRLAVSALPRPKSRVDFDATPRRTLIVTLQLGIALLVAVIVLAVTQPFLPGYAGPLIVGVLFIGFFVGIWRSAGDLDSHVTAGAEAVMAALTGYARGTSDTVQPITEIQQLLPGLGTPVAIRLDPASPAAGKTLADLNLRGKTGATVLAISRGMKSIVAPTASETLLAGDVLALAGTQDAIDAAKLELLGL